ncbi:hypothetical protein KCU79_g176, partial [Aureobasidium melanogenum]
MSVALALACLRFGSILGCLRCVEFVLFLPAMQHAQIDQARVWPVITGFILIDIQSVRSVLNGTTESCAQVCGA